MAPAPQQEETCPRTRGRHLKLDSADTVCVFLHCACVHVITLIYRLGTARDDQFATLRVVWMWSLTLERLKTVPILWEQSWVQEPDTVGSRAGYRGYHCQGRKWPMRERTPSLSVQESGWLDVFMAGLCCRGFSSGWLCASAWDEIFLQAVRSLCTGQTTQFHLRRNSVERLGLWSKLPVKGNSWVPL